MDITKREKRRLRLEKQKHPIHEAQEHVKSQEQPSQVHEPSKSKKYYFIFGAIGIAVIAIISYSVYSMSRPGPYDSFAKCLTEKGASMYGAMDWCKFTQGQKAMFGKSFKYINYHEFNDLDGIKTTPTWVINGEWHENTQSFEKLAALTGCRL